MAWDKLSSGRRASDPPKAPTRGKPAPIAPLVDSHTPEARTESRRSKRVYIAMPVLAKGLIGKESFEETTLTEAVNAHGCLIRLRAKVERGQKLSLTNVKSGEEVECRVAYVEQSGEGKTRAGLEFTRPAAYFWHIAFPADDWTAPARDGSTAENPIVPKRL